MILMNFIEELNQIETIIKVKESKRKSIVEERYESSAEHTFGCILLAQYFLKKIPDKLDELKILKLLSYHDIQNIYFEDINITDENWKNKKNLEKIAHEKTIKTIPKEISEEYKTHYIEFEELKTKESKFAKAIDVLEPVIHASNHKEHWIRGNWKESDLRKHKEKYLTEFPILMEFFNEFVNYAKENNYFIKE
ncbi:HD domain-containing protein [archaeon]|nr:HD domain-containing protein [archaeon]NCP78982.1 HD domain-containing protein [archaeon]NCQ06749.1 HD domain-containing protein [archaeon]NCT57987.1 HD domain-containing protein [archaeon]